MAMYDEEVTSNIARAAAQIVRDIPTQQPTLSLTPPQLAEVEVRMGTSSDVPTRDRRRDIYRRSLRIASKPPILLSARGQSILDKKSGRDEFEKIFGKDCIKNKYSVPIEARARIGKYNLKSVLKVFFRKGVSPCTMMQLIENVEDPITLRSSLETIYWSSPERSPLMLTKIPKNCREMCTNPGEYFQSENIGMDSWRGERAMVRGNRPHNQMTVALWRHLSPKYRRELVPYTSGHIREMWAMLPISEVVRLVGLWLKGTIWLSRFGGRDELDKRVLTWAFLRVRYLSEISKAISIGIIDICLQEENDRIDPPTDHREAGNSTTDAGWYALTQWTKSQYEKDTRDELAKKMIADEKEITRLDKEEGKETMPISKKARQVLVFRLAHGRLMWIDKEAGIVQFGGNSSMFSFCYPGKRMPSLSVLSSETIGGKNPWGWTVHMQEGGGSHYILVVPYAVWVKMIPMWERGFIIWPQMIEAGGLGNKIEVLPQWNDSIGKHCFGGSSLTGYPVGGDPRGTVGIVYRQTPGAYTEQWWQQPRIASMMQDGAFSNESVYGGTAGYCIPTIDILTRLGLFIQQLKTKVWAKKLPSDIEFALVAQILKRTVGMLCQYGTEGVSFWQRPVCGPESKVWWWMREYLSGVRCSDIRGMESADTYHRLLADGGYLSAKWWYPDSIEKDGRGGYRISSEFSRMPTSDFWHIFLKPNKLTLDGEGSIVPWEDVTDRFRDIGVKYTYIKEGIPECIRGVPRDIKKDIERARGQRRGLSVKGIDPSCGDLMCSGIECNSPGQLNRRVGRKVTPDWSAVPEEYRDIGVEEKHGFIK